MPIDLVPSLTMRFIIEDFHQFLNDTRGAITVDYVILAGAVTALTLGSSDVLNSAMRSLAGTVDTELSRSTEAADYGETYSANFENGSQGWTGASTVQRNGIGWVLGPIGNTGGYPSVNRDFEIDPDLDRATFAFNLYSMDDFDGDTGTVFIDGLAVGSVVVDNGTPVFTAATDLDERGIIVRYSDRETNDDLDGNSINDAQSRFEISVLQDPNNPRGTVNLGFGSNASAGTNNEYFAIAEFEATGLAAPSTQ